ncbi:single-stranded-DNA-specific exonuclease RecJ [Marinicella sp. W31]|uniref:single-stranded-DNA-specific exonuclease RecJ n=1 Tax=Marinicella sp. W31 TaxID=3023713 RepID=UPI0037566616
MKLTVKRRPQIDSDVFSSLSIHPLIARLYLARGIESVEQVDYQLKNLLHPNDLGGIEMAAQITIEAIQQKRKIVIVGDFDADGATSTAVALRCLLAFGSVNHDYMVPNRFDYGYGLTEKLVDELIKIDAEVIITVDNGISSIKGIQRARETGMQVVVTDHHLPGPELPPANAIVNPNNNNDAFASKNLAGVGVLFYLMAEVRKQLLQSSWFQTQKIPVPNLSHFLDLVALGTVADVVPLDVNNRIMIAQGLRQIRHGQTVAGIKALFKVADKRIEDADTNSFSYVLAPRLNAAGRLEDMSIGIDLLLSDDMDHAMLLAQQLEDINQQRKVIQEEMQRFADSVLKQLHGAEKIPPGLCLYHPDWHQGVVGLLASKVKEKINRPVIAFARETENSEMLKGSARSVPGLHIRDVLVDIDSQYPDLMTKFGGHAMAAGLTMEHKHLQEFQQVFSDLTLDRLGQNNGIKVIETDGSIESDDLSIRIAELIEQAGPWGQHFTPPMFDDWFIVYEKRLIGGMHTKLVLQTADERKKVDAVAFGLHPNDFPQEGKQTHVCYKPSVNVFRGRRSLQLIVEALIQ